VILLPGCAGNIQPLDKLHRDLSGLQAELTQLAIRRRTPTMAPAKKDLGTSIQAYSINHDRESHHRK
jgi:hypothetical protein